MQAIVTKYLPCTNFRPGRVKASCQAGSLTLSWDHALNVTNNHLFAAKALAEKLGWNYGTWIEGHLPDGSSVFVCNSKYADSFEVL